MSKIVCEICGTKYPRASEQCPICGYTNDFSAAVAAEEETPVQEAAAQAEGKMDKAVEEEILSVEEDDILKLVGVDLDISEFDDVDVYDDDEDDDDEDDEEDDDDDDEDEKSGKKSGIILNILLVIVIRALLCVTGFIFVKHFLPNLMESKETVPPTEATQITTEAPETEEPTVPCAGLVLEYTDLELSEIGQMYLLNVAVQPEDTTDVLTFVSSDENVVIVNEEGRITVIGEGTATVTIACGGQTLECTVNVVLPTEPPTEEPTEPPTEEPTEPPTEEPTEPPTEPLKDVKLEINGNTDVSFNAPGLTFTFKLKNGLQNNEVTWESENEKICTIDENGFLTCTGRGKTNVIVRYGDQEVVIIVRVK